MGLCCLPLSARVEGQELQVWWTRREFLMTSAAVAAVAGDMAAAAEKAKMYGLIGKMKAAPGQRDKLVAILLEGTQAMPGCRSYIVARDATDADAIWITEVWDSAELHQASLALPGVKAAIAQARPILAGFGERFETEPLGGHGLSPA
jgi:quinol monooxygenase YgiN